MLSKLLSMKILIRGTKLRILLTPALRAVKAQIPTALITFISTLLLSISKIHTPSTVRVTPAPFILLSNRAHRGAVSHTGILSLLPAVNTVGALPAGVITVLTSEFSAFDTSFAVLIAPTVTTGLKAGIMEALAVDLVVHEFVIY